MKRIYFVSIVLLALSFNTHLYAWGTTGHRVIAEIAKNHINRKAKREIKKLIGKEPLAFWVNWPDEIKSDTTQTWKETFKWHYINFPSDLSRNEFDVRLKNYDEENLYSAILENKKLLKDKSLPIEKRRVALYFLIHLMGDLEQPLHLGREEDMGGNKVKVNWFRQESNLHSVWDSNLINYYMYSYTEFSAVLDVYNKEENKKLAEGSLEDWIFDSYQLANSVYKGVKDGDKLSYQYAYYMKDTLNQQLLKGGLRLAKVLNEVFD